jgi:hypothetical protein
MLNIFGIIRLASSQVSKGFVIKKYLKAKEELWKLKYYFTMQKYHLQKNPLKKKPKSFKVL